MLSLAQFFDGIFNVLEIYFLALGIVGSKIFNFALDQEDSVRRAATIFGTIIFFLMLIAILLTCVAITGMFTGNWQISCSCYLITMILLGILSIILYLAGEIITWAAYTVSLSFHLFFDPQVWTIKKAEQFLRDVLHLPIDAVRVITLLIGALIPGFKKEEGQEAWELPPREKMEITPPFANVIKGWEEMKTTAEDYVKKIKIFFKLYFLSCLVLFFFSLWAKPGSYSSNHPLNRPEVIISIIFLLLIWIGKKIFPKTKTR